MRLMSNNSTKLASGGVPRYTQLATLFRRRIETGEWAKGQQIPTIDELAEEFGVARATIRQAVGQLEAENLVSRFRAKGTFVRETLPEPIWCEIETDWQSMLSLREHAEIEILSDYANVALPALAKPIGTVAPNYRNLRRRHSQKGQPYLLASIYVDERVARKIPDESFTTMTAGRLAASIPGAKIADARQIMTIGSADFETAELLNIPINAPVCFIDRMMVDQRDRLFLISRGTYRGDVFRLELKMR
ncbi:GntR family transcriptional regulator [Sphingobium sp. MK2]|uniref:GntR family transcriptional regulator n=1 Tax=Sphingobium sp. MK2 TaxID=3116540 RepID=UPI0032E35C53